MMKTSIDLWLNQFFLLWTHITPCMSLCTSLCRCLEWLLNNLMTHQNVELMKELGYVCWAHKAFLVLHNLLAYFSSRYHWNFYDNKDILLKLFMEWIILLMPFYFLQSGGDGAAHPVLGPVCHAGGDGCIYSFEEGSLKTRLPDESSLTKPVSEKFFVIFSPRSGCFCSSTHHGTVPLSSFWLMLMRGSANAGQVPSGHTVENNYLDKYCCNLFDQLQCLGFPCRPVWEGTLPEHRGGRSLSFSVQICSSPVHHQRSGIRTHPGKR